MLLDEVIRRAQKSSRGDKKGGLKGEKVDNSISDGKSNSTENTDKNSESWWRSIVKSFSWRAVGTADTILITYFVTGELKSALLVGNIELITKMFLYTVHERLWGKVKWGRTNKKTEK